MLAHIVTRLTIEAALLKFAAASTFVFRSTNILRFLISAALGKPKVTIAIALLVLAALAGVMTYTGYLVVGVLADYLGTGRVMAGLVLGALFARIPWIGNGKLRMAGLLPQAVRRPLIVSLLVLCSVHFVALGAYTPAGFTGFVTAVLLVFPWLRRTVFDRIRKVDPFVKTVFAGV